MSTIVFESGDIRDTSDFGSMKELIAKGAAEQTMRNIFRDLDTIELVKRMSDALQNECFATRLPNEV